LVVKDSYFRDSWKKPSIWIKNTFTGNKKELREPTMHRLVSCNHKARTTVRYLGHTVIDRYFMARTYMEFCPHGDLRNLLANHARYDGASRTFKLDENGQPIPGIRIPRRALWSFFEDLAEAACTMKYGYNPLNGDPAPEGKWHTILHRDLKPDNIFLSIPRTPDGDGIPGLKIGDWGIAVPEDYDTLENPTRMLGAGTVGWKAPEQHILSLGFDPSYKLSSATNVWSMGRIMLVLVELYPSTPAEVHYRHSQKGEVS
jgi:serine/threonine protein kinase